MRAIKELARLPGAQNTIPGFQIDKDDSWCQSQFGPDIDAPPDSQTLPAICPGLREPLNHRFHTCQARAGCCTRASRVFPCRILLAHIASNEIKELLKCKGISTHIAQSCRSL